MATEHELRLEVENVDLRRLLALAGIDAADQKIAERLHPSRRQPTSQQSAYLEYSNTGSILSPSFVPPGSTILLSSNLRLS